MSIRRWAEADTARTQRRCCIALSAPSSPSRSGARRMPVSGKLGKGSYGGKASPLGTRHPVGIIGRSRPLVEMVSKR